MKNLKLVLAAVLVAGAVSCTKRNKKHEAPAEQPAAAAGGAQTPAASATPKLNNSELKVGIGQEFENFNPLIATMNATTIMQKLVMRALVTIDADGKWVPQLAKSIPSIEAGTAKLVTIGGKKTIQAEWEIIEKAKWGDGVPVTCDDFALAIKIAGAEIGRAHV